MARVGVLVLTVCGACAEWPRVAHVPDATDPLPAGADPGDLVDLTWTVQSEGAVDNDQPNGDGLTAQPVVRGAGVVVEGSLDGVGWADTLVPLALSDDNCPGTTGTRSPLPAGDYLGDVDFFLVRVDASGTLCASVEVDADAVGWDLAPQSVDPCGTPLGVLNGPDDAPVGVDLGGRAGGWALNVGPGTYALGFAGYSPNDVDLAVGYRLAVAMVQPRSDGTEGVCPTHPEASP